MLFYTMLQVATKICRFYDMINRGKAEELCEILSSLKQKSAGVKSSQRGQGNDDDDEDDDMVSRYMSHRMLWL